MPEEENIFRLGLKNISCAGIYQAAVIADKLRQYYRRYNFNAKLNFRRYKI